MWDKIAIGFLILGIIVNVVVGVSVFRKFIL